MEWWRTLDIQSADELRRTRRGMAKPSKYAIDVARVPCSEEISLFDRVYVLSSKARAIMSDWRSSSSIDHRPTPSDHQTHSKSDAAEVYEPELLHDPYLHQREQQARYERIRYLFSQPTPITFVLIGLILGIYLWCLAIDYSVFGQWSGTPQISLYLGANWPPLIHGEGQWWRTLSSVFLHGGLLHIGFNAYALYILGPAVERLSGSSRYFILIVAAGLGGAVASLLWSDTPSVGISGSIFGLVGALLGIIRKFRNYLPDQMATGIRRGMIQIAVINLGIGLVLPMIDNAAHIGGFVTGFIVASLMQSRLTTDAKQERSARMAAIALAVLSVFALSQMYEQSRTCGSSEQAFLECYERYLPKPQADALEPGPSSPPNRQTL